MTLETYEYEKGVAFARLITCPLCGHDFEDGDRRSQHFFEEHDPSDVPALSGGGVGAD